MSKEIKLHGSMSVDKNIRPVKVGDDLSSLSLAEDKKGARITGDLEVQGNVNQESLYKQDTNSFLFKDVSVGFRQGVATYDATSTVIDFRITNKVFLQFDGGNITNLNSFFPNVSGNFILILKQDGSGSRTVTNFRSYNVEGDAGKGSSALVFAGGSNPTLTTDANHVDIISTYWDADAQIGYSVASLDFQF